MTWTWLCKYNRLVIHFLMSLIGNKYHFSMSRCNHFQLRINLSSTLENLLSTLTKIDNWVVWGKLTSFLYCFRKWRKFRWTFLYSRYSLWSFYLQLVRFILINIVSLMLVLRIEDDMYGKLIAHVEVLSIETLTLRLTGYRLMSHTSEWHCLLCMLLSSLVPIS